MDAVKIPVLIVLMAAAAKAAPPAASQLGRDAVHRMAGCYIVDYNYHETRSLDAGYQRDIRVYDVNDKKTVMEWITATDESPTRVRLQHVLFALDGEGKQVPGFMIRHQAEDWEFEPAWVWEYVGGWRWKRVETRGEKGQWVRRITNLDDGLRYQCRAPWRGVGPRAEWQCGNNLAPIPGRETRDMKRRDYQALLRDSRLIVFAQGWLEHQKNVKTVEEGATQRPLAEESGRNWYVRVPDSECAEAAQFTIDHAPFWKLLQETWAGYFATQTSWRETPPGKGAPRWSRLADVEEHLSPTSTTSRAAAARELRAIIEADRL